MTQNINLFVQHVPGKGYRVVNRVGNDFEPIATTEDKYYFHVTSAYAAMGRAQQRHNVLTSGLEYDPAKAPKKETK